MRHHFNDGFLIRLAGCILLLAQAGCVDRGAARVAPQAALACPPWVEFPADADSNADSVYLGCVNRVNLSNMLQNPDDLARGRKLGPASGARESLGVERYNHGKSSAPTSAGSAAPTVIMPNTGAGGDQ